MTISSTLLEKTCTSLLQRNVVFSIKNKILKKGKIELFVQRNFYIVFHILTTNNKKEKIEIPIPFGIENHSEDGLVYFDYRTKTLSRYCPETENFIKNLLIKNKKTSKFGDSILVIEDFKNE
jgi:hypothetical protein